MNNQISVHFMLVVQVEIIPIDALASCITGKSDGIVK